MSVISHAPSAVGIETPMCAAAGLDPQEVRRFLDVGDQSGLPEPKWGPLGQVVFERTYARLKEDGNTETWAETCRRVVRGNTSYAPRYTLMAHEQVELFAAIYGFVAIPGGRHLWVTGTQVSEYRSNCWVSGWESRTSAHFHFLASRLFEGGGVGANYSSDLMRSTSPIASEIGLRFYCPQGHEDYEAVAAAAGDRLTTTPMGTVRSVPDSREGWIDTWAAIIDLSTRPYDSVLTIDVSLLRAHGRPLRTFGGRSSGPAPFVATCLALAGVLNRSVGRRLTALDAMEIDHAIASSVVAGGARRSARMSMMHWSDQQIFDFVACKSDPSAHWTTNISVEVDDAFRDALDDGDAHAHAVLNAVAQGMARNGEPGLVDTSAHSADEPVPIRATNPCGEIGLSTLGAAGESCNLGSVNLEAVGTDDDLAEKAITLLVRFLVRSTLKHHPQPSASVIEETNRRLGLGPMGLQGWAAAHGARLTDLATRNDLLDKLARMGQVARMAADDLADTLDIPRPVKVTAVAPTGTISQLPGTTPGIHPVYARYFRRRVRYADSDPMWRREQSAGHLVEDDIYAESTKVVTYHVRDEILDRYPEALIEQADEVSVDQFVDLMHAVQKTFCAPGIGNAISATSQIPPGHDPVDLARSIRDALGKVKGLTVFPAISRPMAPYEVTSAEEWRVASDRSSGGDSNSGECLGGACPVR